MANKVTITITGSEYGILDLLLKNVAGKISDVDFQNILMNQHGYSMRTDKKYVAEVLLNAIKA